MSDPVTVETRQRLTTALNEFLDRHSAEEAIRIVRDDREHPEHGFLETILDEEGIGVTTVMSSANWVRDRLKRDEALPGDREFYDMLARLSKVFNPAGARPKWTE